jgi:hypothetical protein
MFKAEPLIARKVSGGTLICRHLFGYVTVLHIRLLCKELLNLPCVNQESDARVLDRYLGQIHFTATPELQGSVGTWLAETLYGGKVVGSEGDDACAHDHGRQGGSGGFIEAIGSGSGLLDLSRPKGGCHGRAGEDKPDAGCRCACLKRDEKLEGVAPPGDQSECEPHNAGRNGVAAVREKFGLLAGCQVGWAWGTGIALDTLNPLVALVPFGS